MRRSFLVELYRPRLTSQQVQAMASAPYESPKILGKDARVLVRYGLMEEHPEQRGLFRCTEAGQEVAKLYRKAGWI